MTSNKIILLPVDGSESSLKAISPAKSIATLLNMTIKVLYVSEESCPTKEIIEKLNLEKEQYADCILINLSGDPADIILEEAQKAAYVIMATHGESTDNSKLIGSTSYRVIKNSETPILLIKPDVCLTMENNRWTPKNALIPLNGTPDSAQALTPAIDLLTQTAAEVDLLHISTPYSKHISDKGAFVTPYYTDYQHHEWSIWSKEFLKRFCPVFDRNNIKYNLYLANGDPASEIIAHSKKFNNDIIAMAWHGHIGHMKAQVLQQVIQDAPCPILLIKIKHNKNGTH